MAWLIHGQIKLTFGRAWLLELLTSYGHFCAIIWINHPGKIALYYITQLKGIIKGSVWCMTRNDNNVLAEFCEKLYVLEGMQVSCSIT